MFPNHGPESIGSGEGDQRRRRGKRGGRGRNRINKPNEGQHDPHQTDVTDFQRIEGGSESCILYSRQTRYPHTSGQKDSAKKPRSRHRPQRKHIEKKKDENHQQGHQTPLAANPNILGRMGMGQENRSNPHGGARPKTTNVGQQKHGQQHRVQQNNTRSRQRTGNPHTGRYRENDRRSKQNQSPFAKMNQLLGKDPNTVLLTLLASRFGFFEILRQDISDIETVEVILDLVVKAKSEQHSPQSLLILFNKLLESNFLQLTIVKVLSQMGSEGCHKNIIGSTADILKDMFQLLPRATFPCGTAIIAQMKKLDFNIELSVLKEEVETLEDVYNSTKDQIKKGQPLPDGSVENQSDSKPPEDFRTLPVIPTANDLKKNAKPFLRKNVIKGRYESTDHYLDVQFRLLHEDFMAPLRDGVQELLKMKKMKKNIQLHRFQDVKVYSRVHIKIPIATSKGIHHEIKFDTSSMKNVMWENTKRLMNGSLVCLSKDNFETVYFGTITERDPSKLSKGKIIIKFEGINLSMMEINPYDTYQMVESSAYFEAYRHNLEGLQEIKEESLPLKRYIILADNTDVGPPRYLETDDGGPTLYNFQCLLQDDDNSAKKQCEEDIGAEEELLHLEYLALLKSKTKSRMVPVLDKSSWPTREELQFDESQYKAFQTALTKEFAVIQGPPGTGKTFLGLKIARLLLANKMAWKKNAEGNSRPILVVCYTNHALDQFLEGILAFQQEGVIRIGGRSSSENPAMVECLLRNVKQRSGRIIPEEIYKDLQELKGQLESLDKTIGDIGRQIFQSNNGIINERSLMHFMTKDQVNSLNSGAMNQTSFMMKWLFGMKQNERAPQQTYYQNESAQKKEDIGTRDRERDPLRGPEESLSASGEGFDYEEEDEEQVKNTIALRTFDDNDTENISASEVLEKLKQSENVDPNEIVLTRRQFEMAIEKKGVNDDVWRILAKFGEKRWNEIKTQMKNYELMDEEKGQGVKDLWKLSLVDRWRLYRQWASKYCTEKCLQTRQYNQYYNEIVNRIDEINKEKDFRVIQEANVVAMTTTGAAKYRRILHRVRPAIVIVEEAAEVLEAHIVTTLTKGCEHLILIGDHQQLRPNPAVYDLARKYHLDISLFERMIKNEMQVDRLDIQHRMRPEICELIVPHVYNHLQNHQSVTRYENVKGLTENMYFLSHQHEEVRIEDTKSKSNLYEAHFTVALCRHLMYQGYETTQITILTTYTGQMFQIRRLMPKEEFLGVRVTPVDNYQGEENDIILLSLVRSNEEGIIGFLKVSNRVCVALSRAKKGFYVIGNMDLLAQVSPLWDGILKTLKEKHKVGTSLELQCACHPNTFAQVTEPQDFEKFPIGGCGIPCERRLDCSHVCRLTCHPKDPEHKEYRCEAPCPKKCNEGHHCLRACSDECGDCLQYVPKVLPCDHIQLAQCCVEIENIQCKENCEKLLVCGHPCTKKCSTECITKCQIILPEREWPCGHKLETHCWKNPENFSCNTEVEATLPCGHLAKIPCSSDPLTFECKKVEELQLPCGHTARPKCYQRLKYFNGEINCQELLEQVCTTNSNHIFKVKCFEKHSATCNFPCHNILSCGHLCLWRCGKCGSSRSHSPCQAPCMRPLICGHRCKSTCGLPCPPCQDKCTRRCGHTFCNHPCGEPCEPCKEHCKWKCSHNRCTKACSAICQRKPCNLECPKRLPCGHSCTGCCGEPCPQSCLSCNSGYFNRIAKHTQTRRPYSIKYNRFVCLYPCAHVLETHYMDMLMKRYRQTRDGCKTVGYASCPLCRKAITFCPRYNDIIKRNLEDINQVKMLIKTEAQHVSHIQQAQQNTSLPLKESIKAELGESNLYPTRNEYLQMLMNCANLWCGCDSELKSFKTPYNVTIDLHPDTLERLLGKNKYLLEIAYSKEDDFEELISELKRVYILMQLLVLYKISTGNKPPRPQLTGSFKRCVKIISECTPVYSVMDGKIQNVSEMISQACHKKIDFEEEIKPYLEAKSFQITMRKWMKCRKGHIFPVDVRVQERSVTCQTCGN